MWIFSFFFLLRTNTGNASVGSQIDVISRPTLHYITIDSAVNPNSIKITNGQLVSGKSPGILLEVQSLQLPEYTCQNKAQETTFCSKVRIEVSASSYLPNTRILGLGEGSLVSSLEPSGRKPSLHHCRLGLCSE
jgi:hypothetical protein